MRVKDLHPILLSAAILTGSKFAVAHHSAAEYDRTKSFTMQATVVEFRYANPHPQLCVDAKDENGNVARWQIEIGPNPAGLLRIGWGRQRSETALAPGSVVTVTVAPSKLNPTHGAAQKIVMASGEQVFGAAAAQQN
jgi:hypothetical protein